MGFPSAPAIENQRLENGQYIQDVATALKAAEAYGDYCKGFYQLAGTKWTLFFNQLVDQNPKTSWKDFVGDLDVLNYTEIEGFTSDTAENKKLASDPTKAFAWGKIEVGDGLLLQSGIIVQHFLLLLSELK